MECFCDYCGGTGRVTCDECDGQGDSEGDISTIKLERHLKNYDELVELQKDAKRVIKQASLLKDIRPNRAKSYDEQLRATLFIINEQATKAAK